ncbi:unnamed protein product [Durusdinium trenchii]|uniref:Solute carrier family 40 protein n=1 Tax=Durusdinium trenchii TaxID=1381693 RepID=A0ABP0QZN6_9DINO
MAAPIGRRSEEDLPPSTTRTLSAEALAAFSALEVTRPDVLRATPAYRALEHFGLALRPDFDGDLHWKSASTSVIDTFWSHSWHGGSRKKILTLLVLYNGRAAIAWGFLTVFISALLFAFGILPGFKRNEELLRTSSWCLPCGCFFALAALITSRPRQKRQSILSLAGLLKNSEKMLVLWDQTWSQRLWCLFELAAFLKSRSSQSKKLTIQPTFSGPCSLCAFITMFAAALPFTAVPMENQVRLWVVYPLFTVCGSITGYVAILAFRGYFRSIGILEDQLRSISFDHTRSHCCDVGHSDHGRTIMCDREVVTACVSSWFGSLEAFERCCQGEVLEALVCDLRYSVFTRSWTICIASPVLWASLDLAATWVAIGVWSKAIAWLLDDFSCWLLLNPLFVDYVVFLSRRYSKEAKPFRRELLLNLQVMLMSMPLLGLIVGFYLILFLWKLPPEIQSVIFAGFLLLLTTCSFLIKALWPQPPPSRACGVSEGHSL